MLQDTNGKTAGSGNKDQIADGSKSLTAPQSPKKNTSPVKFSEPPPPSPVASRLTDKEVERAAAQLGMTEFKARGFRDMSVIGSFLEQEGAVKIAAGKYMLNDHLRERALHMIQKCLDNQDDLEAPDPETVSMLSNAMNQLLSSSDRNIKQLLSAARSGMVKPPEEKPKNPLPPKGMQIIAREVHVHSDDKSPNDSQSAVNSEGDDQRQLN